MIEHQYLDVFFYICIQNFVLFFDVKLEPQKMEDFQVSPIARISDVRCFIAYNQTGNVGWTEILVLLMLE